jgi:hypothetical protein
LKKNHEINFFQDFACPVCNSDFLEEIENNSIGSNLQNDNQSPTDPIISIINRLMSPTRLSRGQGSSSRARSRSPRIFTVGSTRVEIPSLRRHAFQFDLDDLMNSFLSTPRQPPVSQRKLVEIPKIEITADLTTTQCSICFDEFTLSESDVRKLPCSHLFHEKCIFPWLSTSGTCPVCRACLSQPGDEAEPEVSTPSHNIGEIRS